MPPSGGGGLSAPADRGKRGKGHRMVPFPPLDSPKPSFEPLSKAFAAKRGRRGLGSVRRAAYGTLVRPEVTLRELPRISVRGQTVQSACFALRKAPLPSSADPWGTKRPCGPLAFRRATGGSRVLRKGWGEEGQETFGVFVSAGNPRHSVSAGDPGTPSPPGDPGTPSPPGEPGTLRRRTAALPPSAEGGQCPRSP